MTNSSDTPIQTLRLTERDKAKLLWAIEQANHREEGEDKRRLRVSCTNNEAMLTLKIEGGSETHLAMLARNLSRWGAALVHGRYIHPHSQCSLTIQCNSGTWHTIPGKVRHARHIQGTIHELGVEFDEPIDLSEFVSLSTNEEARYLRELADDKTHTDETSAVKLSNRVLVVDDFASDRKLLSHWLTHAGLSVMTTCDARSTRAQVQEQVFDLLLIENKLGDTCGADLIRELRQNQFTSPIIAMSADVSPTLEAELLDAGATRLIKKPITEAHLTQMVDELVGIDTSTEQTPILSSHLNDTAMRPLLTEFTRSLNRYIETLRDANAQGDYDAIEHISYRLKSAGQGYGFPAISEQASELLHCLSDESSQIDTIRQITNELISTLNRVEIS